MEVILHHCGGSVGQLPFFGISWVHFFFHQKKKKTKSTTQQPPLLLEEKHIAPRTFWVLLVLVKQWSHGMKCDSRGEERRGGMPCTSCKVLYVGNYPDPSFGPFVQLCCSGIRFFELLIHSGYGIFELLSIFTHFHLFVPIFIHSHASARKATLISLHHGEPKKAGVMQPY